MDGWVCHPEGILKTSDSNIRVSCKFSRCQSNDTLSYGVMNEDDRADGGITAFLK